MSDDGLQKAAILLLSLGEDEAAEVLKHLGPKEVQKIGQAMATLKAVGHEEVETVLGSFQEEAEKVSVVGLDTEAYIRSVMTKALGDSRASNVINRILKNGNTSGIDGLKWMDAPAVAELIAHEHPQIIATILVHLEPDQAGQILNNLNETLRNEVVLRIAKLDGVHSAALTELNEVLTKLLIGSETQKKMPMDGIHSAAEILNYLGSTNEASAMEVLRANDEEMAQKIMDEMFVFDNLLEIDDRGIQLLLREVQSESLIVALKGASQEMRDKVFKNMSQRAAEMMREDLESKGPVRLSEVEAQQKEILVIVRRLADEGQIMLGAKGEDAFV